MSSAPPASPYDDAALYDALFEGFEHDVPFYSGLAARSGGPVLDLGCGTGRVMMHILKAGVRCDGWEPSEAMAARARAKAATAGASPRIACSPADAIPTDRKYRLALCAFNAFSHNLTSAAQLAWFRTVRSLLEPGGILAFDIGHPPFSEWAVPHREPVLELEIAHFRAGWKLRLYDGRTLDPVRLTQRSDIRIDEIDPNGAVAASHSSQTDLRWIFQPELELLLSQSGFRRWTIAGGFSDEPRTDDRQPMVVVAEL